MKDKSRGVCVVHSREQKSVLNAEKLLTKSSNKGS